MGEVIDGDDVVGEWLMMDGIVGDPSVRSRDGIVES
jgi:hypothetical protein